jgi:hypothetical protein
MGIMDQVPIVGFLSKLFPGGKFFAKLYIGEIV